MGYLKEGSPARYHLATGPEGLTVAVHKKSVPAESDLPIDLTSRVAKRLQLSKGFIPPSVDHEWGFGPVIKEEPSQNPSWILYKIAYPQYFKIDGSDKVFGTAATLMLVFGALNDRVRDSDAKIKQHISVKTALDRKRDTWGSPLDVYVYKPLTQWIENQMTSHHVAIAASAIRDSFYQMWNRQEDRGLFDNSFRVFVNPPNLIHFSTMGDACGIDPDDFDKQESYTLTPHNTDSPMQQLSLIAGVARVEQMATNEYYLKNPNQLELGFAAEQ